MTPLYLSIWILEPQVKDARLIRQAWQSLLGTHVSIKLFSSIHSLLSAAGSQLPDLICGELMQTDETGTELILQLRALGDIDLFPITENRSTSSFTLAQRCGIMDYVLKPISGKRLRYGIRRYLAIRQSLSLIPLQKGLSQQAVDACLQVSLPSRETPPDLSRIARILSYITQASSDVTIRDLMTALPYSRSTIRKDLTYLEAEGLIRKQPHLSHRKGRPYFTYHVNAQE